MVYIYARFPLSLRLMERYAFCPRFVVTKHPPIVIALASCYESQVGALIIQAISILVVKNHTHWRSPNDFLVHKNFRV